VPWIPGEKPLQAHACSGGMWPRLRVACEGWEQIPPSAEIRHGVIWREAVLEEGLIRRKLCLLPLGLCGVLLFLVHAPCLFIR
jgi:hypothetical protein